MWHTPTCLHHVWCIIILLRATDCIHHATLVVQIDCHPASSYLAVGAPQTSQAPFLRECILPLRTLLERYCAEIISQMFHHCHTRIAAASCSIVKHVCDQIDSLRIDCRLRRSVYKLLDD